MGYEFGFRVWGYRTLEYEFGDLRTHILRLFGPKDHTIEGFWAILIPRVSFDSDLGPRASGKKANRTPTQLDPENFGSRV